MNHFVWIENINVENYVKKSLGAAAVAGPTVIVPLTSIYGSL